MEMCPSPRNRSLWWWVVICTKADVQRRLPLGRNTSVDNGYTSWVDSNTMTPEDIPTCHRDKLKRTLTIPFPYKEPHTKGEGEGAYSPRKVPGHIYCTLGTRHLHVLTKKCNTKYGSPPPHLHQNNCYSLLLVSNNHQFPYSPSWHQSHHR